MAYVDADGGFLLCVYRAGPHEFYGRWVFSVKSRRGIEVSMVAPVGRLVGALGVLHLRHFAGVDINHRRRQ